MKTSIFLKIAALALLPFLAFIGLSSIYWVSNFEALSGIEENDDDVTILTLVSDAVSNLQLERGKTFLVDQSASGQKQLADLRVKTDQTMEKLGLEVAAHKDSTVINFFQNAKKSLLAVRNFISSDFQSKQVEHFLLYKDVVSTLQNIFVDTMEETSSIEVRNAFESWYYLQKAKENTALLRGFVSGNFLNSGSVSASNIGLLAQFRTSSTSFVDLAIPLLSANSKLLIQEMYSMPEWADQEKMYQKVLSHQSDFLQVDRSSFFEAETKIVQKMESVAQTVKSEVNQFIDRKKSSVIFNLTAMAIGLAGILVLLSVTGFYFVRSIQKPLRSILTSLTSISSGDGDLTQKIPLVSRDEFGNLAQLFNEFQAKLSRMILTLKAQNDELSKTSRKLNEEALQSSTAVSQIAAASVSVEESSIHQSSSFRLAQESVSNFVENVKRIDSMTSNMKNQTSSAASAVEEIAASLEVTTNLAEKTSAGASDVERTSTKGDEAMQNLSEKVEKVSGLAEKIGEITALILDISGQTNLLSMNAAIEAAHAGESGKGFAVVAEEIRRLAETSSSSAKEIQSTVKMVQLGIAETRELTVVTVSLFQSLLADIRQLQKATLELASSLKEQRSANQTVLVSVDELRRGSQSTAEALEDQLRQSEAVTSVLNELGRITESINLSTSQQKQGLQNISVSVNHLKEISSAIASISDQIHEDFGRFKT